jgi:predicted esterase/catechol 2,3-dioxygenase-like lactoylglutathione lyase family enzyme
MVEETDLSMPCHTRQPKVRMRKPPMLLLLHGLGANEIDFLNMVDNFDDRFLIISLHSSFPQTGGKSAWFNMERIGGAEYVNTVQAEFSRNAILSFIPEAVRSCKVDPGQVYMMGFSQGAVIALSLLLTEPDTFSGIVAISGQILPETRSMMAPTNRFKGKPVLLMHGLQDPIYPISFGRAASVFLASLPLTLDYHIIPDMDHIITPGCLEKARLWLSKRLDMNGIFGLPDQVEFPLQVQGVHLKVKDLDRAISFYTRFLGMELVERTGKTYAFLTNNQSHHVVALQNVGLGAPRSVPEATGLFCVSFEVPDQYAFAKMYKKLIAAGIKVSLTDHLINWGMYFQDPDGNGIEICWDTRELPGRSHLWQGRDLPIDPEKILALLT